MKRRMLLGVTVLILLAVLSGCGNPVKIEEELINDLNTTSQIFMVEGSQVTELSIIKRLTDEDNKTDTVYVSILIDHPNATENRAYVMNYTLYNEGWILDDVEDYYGDEAIWKVSPKGAPTNEQVMAELIAYSNAQIDAAYVEQYISEELTHTYFFEEGKYATKIYTGSFTSDMEYSCIVETERVFNYVKVVERQMLHFCFDIYVHTWKLHKADTIIHWADQWYLDGTWTDPVNGAIIQFSQHGNMLYNGDANYDATYSIGENTVETSFWWSVPSSHRISTCWCYFGDLLSEYVKLNISPDSVLYFDSYNDFSLMLEPSTLVWYPSQLDRTGILDMSSQSEYDDYRNTADQLLKSIFIESDSSYLDSMYHPSISQDTKNQIKDTLFPENSGLVVSFSHYSTELLMPGQNDRYGTREYLRNDIGVSFDDSQIIVCSYYMKKDYVGFFEFHTAVFTVEDNQLYLLSIR